MPSHPLSVAVVHALGVLVAEGDVPWRGALPGADEAEDARAFRDGAGYASSLPLRLGGRSGLSATELAVRLAGRLTTFPEVAAAVVTGPGYVEVEPEPEAVVRAALRAGRLVSPRGPGPALDPLPAGGPGRRATDDLPEALRAAVAEVGADAVRFALARRVVRRPEALDLAVLGRADDRNPVHAVQLAHARLVAALRQADSLGLRPEEAADVAAELLNAPADIGLASALADFPAVVSRSVRLRRADVLARHLERTAESTHRFVSSGRLLPQGDIEPDDSHRARLRLAAATAVALAQGLDLLGVTAPERM